MGIVPLTEEKYIFIFRSEGQRSSDMNHEKFMINWGTKVYMG